MGTVGAALSAVGAQRGRAAYCVVKAVAQPMPARKFSRLGPTPSDLLHGLSERARDNLNDDDMASLSIAGDAARLSLRCVASLCAGLTCRTAGQVGPAETGSFQIAGSAASLPMRGVSAIMRTAC